jgi:glutathione S-transferase
MEPVVIVILLALVEYTVLAAQVGRARAKYGIKAPAITGHDVFERTFRVHQNGLENLVIFVPAVWIFGAYVSPVWAAALGVVYVVARVLYARGYVAAAEKRGPGAGISGITNIVLLLGGLFGVIRTFF